MAAELNQGGQALKMLATAARLDIEDFVGKEVFVEVCQTYDLHLCSALLCTSHSPTVWISCC